MQRLALVLAVAALAPSAVPSRADAGSASGSQVDIDFEAPLVRELKQAR